MTRCVRANLEITWRRAIKRNAVCARGWNVVKTENRHCSWDKNSGKPKTFGAISREALPRSLVWLFRSPDYAIVCILTCALPLYSRSRLRDITICAANVASSVDFTGKDNIVHYNKYICKTVSKNVVLFTFLLHPGRSQPSQRPCPISRPTPVRIHM